MMTGMTMVRAAATAAETDPKKRVVVTGMGVVSCFGNDVDTFYDRRGLSIVILSPFVGLFNQARKLNKLSWLT